MSVTADVSHFRNLVKMASSELFPELRAITNISERRETTQQIYEYKMRLYRSKSAYRKSIAHHLVEEVHPMFRNAFDDVLRRSCEGKVKVKEFVSVNNGLHHHHGLEDVSWFPSLRLQHPEIGTELDILESDHAALVAMETAIRNGSYVALVEFVATLNDHLNREELLIVPCVMRDCQ